MFRLRIMADSKDRWLLRLRRMASPIWLMRPDWSYRIRLANTMPILH